MTTTLWISVLAAVALLVGSGLTWLAGVTYVPSMLMVVAALTVMGVGMATEDRLLAKYDTPHDEDTHPPQLIALRAGRAILLVAMGILAFAMLL